MFGFTADFDKCLKAKAAFTIAFGYAFLATDNHNRSVAIDKTSKISVGF